MTITFKKHDNVYDYNSLWNSRNVAFNKTSSHNGRIITGYTWTIEKSAHGVSIENENDERNSSIYFTFAEFKEFIEHCKWIDDCNVIEDGA